MIAQHDPDFQSNGTITVLDNHYGGPMTTDPNDVGANGGSRILAIDPATNSATTLYSSSKADPFYTERRGKHQLLNNGNILITETDAGRAFEVSPEGEIVWSFINQYDEQHVGWIMQATRYAEDYTAIQEIKCSKD